MTLAIIWRCAYYPIYITGIYYIDCVHLKPLPKSEIGIPTIIHSM